MKHYDVLIVGAGIVGLSCALAMSIRGFQVALFDKQFDENTPPTSKNLRVYAINEASKRLWQDLNLWEDLSPDEAFAYKKMHIWDAFSKAELDFDARSIASTDLGYILYESDIKATLMKAIAAQQNITCFQKIVHAQESKAEITLTDGNTYWTGKLLIIADGRDSPLRAQFKVPVHEENYHQAALIATVRTEKAHAKTAYQIFQKNGPLAFLPLEDPHLCSIVWTNTPEEVERLKTLSEEDFNRALKTAFQAHLGAITLCSSRQSFPLMMRHVRHYVGTNWLLMGDAAHTIHPLAGLGLNLGLADLSSFLKLIDASKQDLLSSKILQAYQRERKHAVWKVILFISGINRLFKNQFSPLIALRALGLKMTNQWEPVKRMLIDQARGVL